MNITTLVRRNIRELKPYSCARKEFKGDASIFLDANENPMNNPYNRYPDPLQEVLKSKIAGIKKVRPSQIMLGVGSDEPIDLLIRIFCEPGVDNIIAIDPTYGMYQVCADINDAAYRKVLLNEDFSLDAARVLSAVDANSKLIFLCSPNNPTGNSLDREEISKVITGFNGIVVLDEAYIDFSSQPSLLSELDRYSNLVIIQTFSKAWGMASVRCGMAFASETIVGYLNNVKYPYNLNLLTQDFVIKQLDHEARKNEWVAMILEQRAWLEKQLGTISWIEKVYASDANFLLVKVPDANMIYNRLVENGIIVRNRNAVSLCRGCLRFTIGTHTENLALINELKNIK